MGRHVDGPGSPEAAAVGVADLRQRSVAALMDRYDFPRAHATQVRFLADRLAEQLAGALVLGEEGRLILGCAALLHDIGWHFGQAKHHRRSYELIKGGGLSGFTAVQVELIALVARYHRKARPKVRHEAFSRLSAMDRQTVMRLAGVLRVADGLDRSHRAAVQDVSVRLGSRRVRLVLTPRVDDVESELWAAGRKKRLLETVLGRTVGLTVGADSPERGIESC